MPYNDLIKVRVWSIYREKEGKRVLLSDKNIIEVIKAVGNWKG